MNKDLTKERARARQLYMQGITSVVQLATIVDVPRQTITRWKKEDGWESLTEKANVSPFEIAQQITSLLQEMLAQMKELRALGEPVSTVDLKAMIQYVRALRQLDEDYDIRSSLIAWSNKLINFIGTVSTKELPNKKEVNRALQQMLPLFLKSEDAKAEYSK